MKDIIKDRFSELLLATMATGAGCTGLVAMLCQQPDIAKVALGAAGGLTTAIIALSQRSQKSPNQPGQ